MLQIVLGFLAAAVGFILLLRGSKKTHDNEDSGPWSQPTKFQRLIGLFTGRPLGGLLLAGSLFLFASTSFVFVDAERVGHLKRIYASSELPPGRIIALAGQKGPQSEILGPGFHLRPFVRVLYDMEQFDVVTVPDGFYGKITALDGAPMPEGMFIAPKFSDEDQSRMLNADGFLNFGGLRGPQETVLKPGRYRLNRYLFDIETNTRDTQATVIPAGFVGVVKSNVKQPNAQCVEEEVKVDTIGGALAVPLVPKGCVGVWKDPLFPGAYYLNRAAYTVTMVDTRVQTWEYKGGYTKRKINLSIDQQGNLRQQEEVTRVEEPSDAADEAVFVKIEGWDIPLELRVLVQVDPANAPIVVGSVGGLEQIENRILTPAIRSIVRNVAGSTIRARTRNDDGDLIDPPAFEVRPTLVLDLIENRNALEDTIEAAIIVEGRKAGVNIKEIRLGEPAIPPELLLSRLRVQLADQLSEAYERETKAQNKRIETEQARSTADQQPRLVEAQIAVQVANQRERERAALGRAERQFLEELARGQKAQATVLGEDRVAMLQALEKVLASLEAKPQLVGLISRLVPHTVVGGSDKGGLAGAAAILGSVMDRSKDPSNP